MTKRKDIEPPFLRTEHNYDRNAASAETALYCPEPTLTKQEFAEESDINFIADKFHLTGEMPTVVNPPKYGDFTGIFDFQSAQNSVIDATRRFMELPAKLRARFQNDPQRLMTFLDDPGNREEAEFLGLVQKRAKVSDATPPKETTHETGTESLPDPKTEARTGTTRTPKNQAAARGTEES